MRLFIAIDLPPEIRSDLHACCQPLRDGRVPVRWSRPESYHLTLKFLGDVDEASVGGLTAALDRVTRPIPVFDLLMVGFGAFPHWRRPRIVWAGVRVPPALSALHSAIDEAMADLGFDSETRPFHAHVTLGRARDKSGRSLDGLEARVQRLNYRAAFQVATIDLVQSHLTPRGARYRTVHRSALSNRGT